MFYIYIQITFTTHEKVLLVVFNDVLKMILQLRKCLKKVNDLHIYLSDLKTWDLQVFCNPVKQGTKNLLSCIKNVHH